MKRLLSYYSAVLLLALFGLSTANATGIPNPQPPSVQARYITFSNVQSTSVSIGWINGNGVGRMVVAYPGAVTAPTGLASAYSLGTSVGTGTVVFKGTARKVDVTDLTPATTYTVKVYEYAADGTIKTDNGTLNPRTVTTPASATPAAVTVLGTFDGLANATGTAYAGGPLVGLKWNQVAGHNDATSWNLTVQKFNGSEFVDVVTYANLDLGTLEDGTPESYIAYLTPGQYQYKVQAVQGTTLGAWSAYSTPFDVTYANVTTNNVADIKSVSNTPVVITITDNYPTIVAEDNILTDAVLTFRGLGEVSNAKIEKITYQVGSGSVSTITDADGYTLTNGEVYFSDILQGLGVAAENTQTPLIGHSGKNITWTVTVSGLDEGSYSAEIIPVAYILDGTTKEKIGNLAEQDDFSITMANETVTINETAQIMCGEVDVNFDITYPAIENVDAIVKNNAILKATPALPTGTVVKWSYEGNAGTDYTVVAGDKKGTDPNFYTEIPLSAITNTTATLVAHDGRTDNWEFTIVNADLAKKDYTFEVCNVAQINTTNYEYNHSTVDIEGLPTVTSSTNIADFTTVSGTPVIINESITFPEFTAPDNILTDALIELTTPAPSDAKVVSVKYNGTEVMDNAFWGENGYYIPQGTTKLLLSTIINKPAAKLNGHSNLTTNWEIVIVTDYFYDYSTNVALTPIAYTEAPTFGTEPTGCYSAIGEADEFNLTFNRLITTTASAHLTPEEQDYKTLGKAALTFDIQYPAISGIGTDIKNDALLICQPAAAVGTTIRWKYNGSEWQTYTITADDTVQYPEIGFRDRRRPSLIKTNAIWLSKITGTTANLLAHNERTDNWEFEITGNEFSSKDRFIHISNTAYYGEIYDLGLLEDIYKLEFASEPPADMTPEQIQEIINSWTDATRRFHSYNSSHAIVNGVLPVELSDITDVKAIVGTPIILTQTATYQPEIFADENVLTDAKLSTTLVDGFPAGMKIAKVTYQDGTGTTFTLPINEVALQGQSEVYLSDILTGGAAPLLGHANKTITWNFYITGAEQETTEPIAITITPVSYLLADDVKTDEATIGNVVDFNVEYVAADAITATEQVNTYCGTTAKIDYDVTYPIMLNIDSRVKNNAVITCDKDIPAGAKIKWNYNDGSVQTYTVPTTTMEILLSDITGVRGVDMFAHSGNTYNWDFTIEGLDNTEDYTFTITNIAEITDDGTTYSEAYDYFASEVNVKTIPTVTQNEITNISTIINTPVIVSANVVYPTLTDLVGSDILLDEKISTTLQGGFPAGLTITKLVYHNGANVIPTTLASPFSLDGKESVYLTDILGSNAVTLLSESGSDVTFDVVIEAANLTEMTTIPVSIQTVAYTSKPTQPTDCEKVLGTEEFEVVYNMPDFKIAETGNVLAACAGSDISFTMLNNYPTIAGMNSAVKTTGFINSGTDIPANTIIDWSFNAGAASGSYTVPSATNQIALDEIVGLDEADLVSLSANSGVNETWAFTIKDLAVGTYDIALNAVAILGAESYTYATIELNDVTVNASPTLTAEDITISDESICEAGTGSITIDNMGAGFEYSIDNGANFVTTREFTDLAADDYDVVVKNTTGCVSEKVTVTVGTEDEITFTATPTAPSNYGVADGKITISNVDGGNGTYTYAITNVNTTTYNTAENSSEFTSLAEGKYYVKVIDANGCFTESAELTVSAAGPLLVNTYSPVDNATNVVGSADFTLTFNKTVTRGVSGWVKIFNVTNTEKALDSIQYNDASKLLISGNVVTIKHIDLPQPGSFYVTIDGTVFRDLANVYFAGITKPTVSPAYEGWNFSSPLAVPASITNLRRVTNNKTSITIAYDKPASVNVLVLAKMGGTGATHSDGVALIEYNEPSFNTTNAGSDAANALITNPNTLTTGGLTDYVKVYAGTATQVKVTGIAANTWTRFYVIPYATDGTDYSFNTNVRSLDYKTNRFKDGVEGDNETPTAFGVSAIAPNPVSDMINFTVEAVETSEFTYTVYSMTGETLYTMNQVLTAGSNNVSIATSKLGEVSAGTYLLRIANGSDETLVPFVIVK